MVSDPDLDHKDSYNSFDLTDGQSVIILSKATKTPQDRRTEFLEASLDLFNQKGFENTSVDDIIARVGVAKGLFYYYFSSKEEILQIQMERLHEEIEAAIAIAMKKKGLTAMERFNELVAINRDVVCRSSALIMYFRQERNKAFHLSMERRAREFMTGAMEEIIQQGVDEGVFKVHYPRETATAILAMIYSLVIRPPEGDSKERSSELIVIVQDLTERLLGMEPGTFQIREGLLPPGP
jgi:AcrR family transcriptional regulator